MQKEREPISKKIRPPKANTWAGEDGRAKGEGRYSYNNTVKEYFH